MTSAAGHPDVSVVIVSYQTAGLLRRCLRSLETDRAAKEIIVVDNASSDGSAAMIRDEFPHVKLVAEDLNHGFARGVNIGARHGNGWFLLLLNPDTVVHDHAVASLAAFARENPDFALFGGRTVDPDGTFDPRSCWHFPTLWGYLCFATGISSAFRSSPRLNPEASHWSGDAVQEVDFVSGGFLLLARSTWEALGGLDERYFLYGEDADFGLRARAAGHRAVVSPTATIEHSVGASSASRGAKMVHVMQGRATYVRQHWSSPRREIAFALMLSGTGLRALMSAVLRRRGAWDQVWSSRREWLRGFPTVPEAHR